MKITYKPWRVAVAERKQLVGMLIKLSDAAWHVPVKQHDRTPDQQRRVEEFTTAVVEARELIDRLADKHYGDDAVRRSS